MAGYKQYWRNRIMEQIAEQQVVNRALTVSVLACADVSGSLCVLCGEPATHDSEVGFLCGSDHEEEN